MGDTTEFDAEINRLLDELDRMNVEVKPGKTLYDLVPDLQREWGEIENEAKEGKDRQQARVNLAALIIKLQRRVVQLRKGNPS